jgi:molybdate transport system substrate-binding protein
MSSELRIFVPVAIRAIMNSLIPRMELAARVSVTQLIDLNPAIPERISVGEAYDIGLTNPQYAKALIAAGHADGASHRAFGRVPLAVGRKVGPGDAIRKDVQDIEALLGGAESIAYTGQGTSGQTYLDVMERLGLKNTLNTKSRAMDGGEPVASVALGETELAVAPLTTVLSTPGVVPAAVFPEELGTHIDMSVFLSTTPQTGAATALAFLTASELDDELDAAGVLRFQLD